ncbi:hypothetical protein [Erythrobacter tepidarius]|uniref:hypothetical protein n=1 Tax=Erythrobacter tepidarius TaxID=60454 RepID=UPI0011803427|nr:hypothetical protein [Erythrobacter tepidarius]
MAKEYCAELVNEPETGLPKQCLRQASGIALGLLRRQPFSPRDPHPVGFARLGAFAMAFAGLPADVAICGGEARAETVARITLPTVHTAKMSPVRSVWPKAGPCGGLSMAVPAGGASCAWTKAAQRSGLCGG